MRKKESEKKMERLKKKKNWLQQLHTEKGGSCGNVRVKREMNKKKKKVEKREIKKKGEN